MNIIQSLRLVRIFLSVAFAVGAVKASAQDVTAPLPGHHLSESGLIRKSTDVAVITLVAKGKIDLGPPGVLNYFGAKVRIDKSLKGAATGEVTCIYDLREAPDSDAEREPILGTQYIAFMQGRDPHVVLRILRFSAFSEKHETEIQKMVASADPPAAK